MYQARHTLRSCALPVFCWTWLITACLGTTLFIAAGFLWVFTIGGFSRLILSVAPIDIQVQDTYYVVGHFHYVLAAGSLFCMFSGYYYRVPKWTGHMVNEWRARFHFWNSLHRRLPGPGTARQGWSGRCPARHPSIPSRRRRW